MKTKLQEWYYNNNKTINACLELVCEWILPSGKAVVKPFLGYFEDIEEGKLQAKVFQNEDLLKSLQSQVNCIIEEIQTKTVDLNSSSVSEIKEIIQSERSQELESVLLSLTNIILQETPIDFTLNERYQILEKIGLGGQGSVYRAKDLQTGIEVALKVFHQRKNFDFQSICSEYKTIVNKLFHLNIVQCRHLDHDPKTGCWYLVMDFIQGNNLRHFLRKKSPISLSTALKYLEPVAQVLDFSHKQNIIHGDLKPENILVRAKDESIFVTDFGLARDLGLPSDAILKMKGTIPYMAPEQYFERSTFQSDIWAFGVILYEMLEGEHPFPGKTKEEYQNLIQHSQPKKSSHLTELQWKFLEKILSKDAKERPTSFQYIIEQLRFSPVNKDLELVFSKQISQLMKTLYAFKESSLQELSQEDLNYQEILTNLKEEQVKVSPPLKILVIGEYNVGKSTFINSLLGEDLLPSDIVPTDTVISRVMRGDHYEHLAEIHFSDGTVKKYYNYQEIWKHIDRKHNYQQEQIKDIKIYHQASLLREIEIINTPGINSFFQKDTELVRSYLKEADGLIWLFNSQSLSGRYSLDFLEEMEKYQFKSIAVLNMIDLCYEYDDDLDEYGDINIENVNSARKYTQNYFGKYYQELIDYASLPILDIFLQVSKEGDYFNQYDSLAKWGYFNLISSLERHIYSPNSVFRQNKFTKMHRKINKDYQLIYKAVKNSEKYLDEKIANVSEENKELDVFMKKLQHQKIKSSQQIDEKIKQTTQEIIALLSSNLEDFIDNEVGILKMKKVEKLEELFKNQYLDNEGLENHLEVLRKEVNRIIQILAEDLEVIAGEDIQIHIETARYVQVLQNMNSSLAWQKCLLEPTRGASESIVGALLTIIVLSIIPASGGLSAIVAVGVASGIGWPIAAIAALGVAKKLATSNAYQEIRSRTKEKVLRELKMRNYEIRLEIEKWCHDLLNQVMKNFQQQIQEKSSALQKRLVLEEEKENLQKLLCQYKEALDILESSIKI